MNIFINVLSNSISAYDFSCKKGIPFFAEQNFSYSLKTTEAKTKAIQDFLTEDISKVLSESQNNSLILSDDYIFLGLSELPPFSKKKTEDAFITKFKVDFPKFSDFYLTFKEYERNNKNTYMLYTICRIASVDKILDVFKKHSINIKNVNHLSQVISKKESAKNNYPTAYLFIGTNASELLIAKGNSVIATSLIELGENELLDKSVLQNSTYNTPNNVALKYASFHKTHYDTKDLLTDDMILKNPVHDSFKTPEPRESRILKGLALENYHIRQNFMKFNTHVIDLLEFYSQSPWFLPIFDIKVLSTDEVYANLLQANTESKIKFTRADITFKSIIDTNIENNKLFTSKINVKERKKIDWSKFLTMEIGKKKKA